MDRKIRAASLSVRLFPFRKKSGEFYPNSLGWFISSAEASMVLRSEVPFAAEVTRPYLLGFEVGVGTEFERPSKAEMELNCSAAALAAGGFVPK